MIICPININIVTNSPILKRPVFSIGELTAYPNSEVDDKL